MASPENYNYLKKSAAAAGVFLAVFLIILKFIAFLKTDSLAIFSSLADSKVYCFPKDGFAGYFLVFGR